MIRNNNHKQIIDLSNQKTLPIINGLTEQSHPCQILGDFLTIQEIFKNKKNILLTWIGDFNNVLVSLLELQNIYLFNLNIVLPSKIFKLKEKQIRIYKNNKTKFFNNPLEGVRNSNCIMTDVWISMGDKQKNKIKYFRNFTVNKKIMNNSAKNAIFMHCLPAKRGQEVSSDVLDSKKSVILQQAKNRMYIQQAILIYVLKK